METRIDIPIPCGDQIGYLNLPYPMTKRQYDNLEKWLVLYGETMFPVDIPNVDATEGGAND